MNQRPHSNAAKHDVESPLFLSQLLPAASGMLENATVWQAPHQPKTKEMMASDHGAGWVNGMDVKLIDEYVLESRQPQH